MSAAVSSPPAVKVLRLVVLEMRWVVSHVGVVKMRLSVRNPPKIWPLRPEVSFQVLRMVFVAPVFSMVMTAREGIIADTQLSAAEISVTQPVNQIRVSVVQSNVVMPTHVSGSVEMVFPMRVIALLPVSHHRAAVTLIVAAPARISRMSCMIGTVSFGRVRSLCVVVLVVSEKCVVVICRTVRVRAAAIQVTEVTQRAPKVTVVMVRVRLGGRCMWAPMATVPADNDIHMCPAAERRVLVSGRRHDVIVLIDSIRSCGVV